MNEKGDEAFVVKGVVLPVKDMSDEEVGLMENAGFLRAEFDGHHWLFPTAKSLNEATGGQVDFSQKFPSKGPQE